MRTMEQPRARELRGTVIPPAVRNHRVLTALIGVLVLVVAGVVSIAGLRSGEEAVLSPMPSDVPVEGVVPSAQSAIVLSPAQLTDAARWTALAEAYAVAEQMAHPDGLRRGQVADVARLTALAEAMRPELNEGLTAGQLADAARLTALAEAYGLETSD